MAIWGKILGGAAGFALGGPIGALVGTAAGHAVDHFALSGSDGHNHDATQKIAFTIGVIALGAKMARADGTVSDNEVRAFHQVFRVPPGEERNVERVFNLARRDSSGFESYAKQIASLLADRPAVLEEVLDSLFHIAKADGHIKPEEIDYLRAVADIFGFSEVDFQRILASHGGAERDNPYAVLGITADASDRDVRQAYRRLLREHHPDLLMGQGLPPEFMEVANAKMAAINAAYDEIARQRGMS